MARTARTLLREIADECARLGAPKPVFEHNKGHIKVRLQTPHGPRFLVTGGTPSDRRGIYNVKADLRRLLRAKEPASCD